MRTRDGRLPDLQRFNWRDWPLQFTQEAFPSHFHERGAMSDEVSPLSAY
jgi:hypothetical protein